jgi:hypothetical protein
MNRCTTIPYLSLRRPQHWLLALALSVLALGASAQAMVRGFPPNALRGTLVITAAPEITLDGKPDRLSPGARIRNPDNMLLLSGVLVGQELVVNYTRESAGMVHEVWILSPQEAQVKRKRAGSTSSFSFGSDPPQVNLQVPFDQLPKYKP